MITILCGVIDSFDGDGLSTGQLIEEFDRLDEWIERSDDAEELLEDIEEELSLIINDAEWRSDQCGPECVTDERVLRLVYERLASLNQNIEVVLASNPHLPLDVALALAQSDFEWEEDGTCQALARNQTYPELLGVLAFSDSPNVRWQVARNAQTPREILERLIEDEAKCYWQVESAQLGEVTEYQGFIRWAVISNSNTPREALERVANDGLASFGPKDDFFRNEARRALRDLTTPTNPG